MLICNNCGRLVNEDDLEEKKISIDFHGDIPYCICGGQFETAVECDCCKQYSLEYETELSWRFNIRFCHNCIDKHKDKYKRVFNQLYGDTEAFIDWVYENTDKGEKT